MYFPIWTLVIGFAALFVRWILACCQRNAEYRVLILFGIQKAGGEDGYVTTRQIYHAIEEAGVRVSFGQVYVSIEQLAERGLIVVSRSVYPEGCPVPPAQISLTETGKKATGPLQWKAKA